MAEQSEFSKLPKKQLIFIIEKLIDNEFPVGNPYVYSDYEGHYKTLSNVAKYFNINVNDEDVQFFAKLLEVNEDLIAELFSNNGEQMKNKQLIEQLEIPVAKSYDLDYSVWGTCTYTDYKVQEFDSYDEDWVKGSAHQQRSDGNWDMWDGRDNGQTEYDNYEESDYSFDDVSEVNEKPVQESLLSKLVIENTSEVVNSLDKKTLLELRRIIDSKLRLL